jgi:hypothetical protein
LKPNHLSDDDYPASVINEYFVMSLARSLGLSVPPVFRRYTPEPVYIIERFDRLVDNAGRTQRRHIIDACQFRKNTSTPVLLAGWETTGKHRKTIGRRGIGAWVVAAPATYLLSFPPRCALRRGWRGFGERNWCLARVAGWAMTVAPARWLSRHVRKSM